MSGMTLKREKQSTQRQMSHYPFIHIDGKYTCILYCLQAKNYENGSNALFRLYALQD